MQVYLVGGAVRDEILKNPIKDNDYVVVGGTPEHFLEQGYEQVGADFPVFLHPETKDEYALARKERKTGLGYAGFTCEYDPTISLKDDLYRRDLTINALAKNIETGEIIDYFDGLKDIKNKTLRHISDHFRDDPLRLLRIARFAARYKKQGFTIAPETLQLMKEMVINGEIKHLTPERVKLETDKALLEDSPSEYFYILKECGALEVLFPEINNLFGVPQPKEHHPEIDTGIHTMMVIEQAKLIAKREKLNKSDELLLMWVSLTHDLGKALTPKEILPQHINHEKRGVDVIDSLAGRIKMTTREKQISKACSLVHTKIHSIKSIKKAKKILELLKQVDYFRKPEILNMILLACEADAKGRTGFENRNYDQPNYIQKMIKYIPYINQSLIAEEVKSKKPTNLGLEIAEAIDFKRKEMISLSFSIHNNKEIFISNYSFLKGIKTKKDIENAIRFSKQLSSNQNMIDIITSEMKIDKNNPFIERIIILGRKLSKINADKYLSQGLEHTKISKIIEDDKLKVFQSVFPECSRILVKKEKDKQLSNKP